MKSWKCNAKDEEYSFLRILWMEMLCLIHAIRQFWQFLSVDDVDGGCIRNSEQDWDKSTSQFDFSLE